MADEKKEKITVDTVIDDVVGGVATGVGVVGASVAMKMASGKLNPFLISALAIVIGIAGRITSNMVDNAQLKAALKDLASGFVAAGSLDATMKLLDKVLPTWRGYLPASAQAALPTLSGPQEYKMLNAPAEQSNAYKMLNGLGKPSNAYLAFN